MAGRRSPGRNRRRRGMGGGAEAPASTAARGAGVGLAAVLLANSQDPGESGGVASARAAWWAGRGAGEGGMTVGVLRRRRESRRLSAPPDHEVDALRVRVGRAGHHDGGGLAGRVGGQGGLEVEAVGAQADGVAGIRGVWGRVQFRVSKGGASSVAGRKEFRKLRAVPWRSRSTRMNWPREFGCAEVSRLEISPTIMCAGIVLVKLSSSVGSESETTVLATLDDFPPIRCK